MDSKKQTEEMAKAIERTGMLDSLSRCEVVAYELYKEGYRKHGSVEHKSCKWVRRNNEMMCPTCRFIYYSNNDDFNYCPNCGVRMDGHI